MTNENQEVEINDFELPVLEESSPVRVHQGPGESTCVSCEG